MTLRAGWDVEHGGGLTNSSGLSQEQGKVFLGKFSSSHLKKPEFSKRETLKNLRFVLMYLIIMSSKIVHVK